MHGRMTMYRGGDNCDAHLFATAVGCCCDCGSRVCSGCEGFAGVTRRCAGCARRFRRRRQLLERTTGAVLFLAVLIAGLSLGAVLGIASTEIDPPTPTLFTLSN
jgi:hypothetical protein